MRPCLNGKRKSEGKYVNEGRWITGSQGGKIVRVENKWQMVFVIMKERGIESEKYLTKEEFRWKVTRNYDELRQEVVTDRDTCANWWIRHLQSRRSSIGLSFLQGWRRACVSWNLDARPPIQNRQMLPLPPYWHFVSELMTIVELLDVLVVLLALTRYP